MKMSCRQRYFHASAWKGYSQKFLTPPSQADTRALLGGPLHCGLGFQLLLKKLSLNSACLIEPFAWVVEQTEMSICDVMPAL